MARKLVIFGAGLAGKRAFARLNEKDQIVAFVDNDEEKSGRFVCGIRVGRPEELRALHWDAVVIASHYAREIYAQLEALGVPKERIELDLSPPDREEHLNWKARYAPALAQFKGKHEGDDCFILGNGPSLRSMDLSLLNEYNTFGLNKIHLAFSKTSFRPSYHVAINKFVIEQCWKEFLRLDCPSFLSYSHRFGDLEESPNIKLLYTSHGHGFSEDICDIVSEGFTVTYVALQLAWYMGFSRVFLIGVDHRFKAEGAPNETQVMGREDPNHFDSSYFANQSWQLPDLDGSEFSYQAAKRAFESAKPKRCVYDATLDGALEVFPKIGFDEALELCKRRKE